MLTTEDFYVERTQRNRKYGHKSFCLFFTGLSGSGKSTLAKNLEHDLFNYGYKTYALDGDNTRQGLNSDLGFTKEDRAENIRRIAEVSKLFVDAGNIVTASFIAPYERERGLVRELLGQDLVEVYVSTPLDECESRDVKGIYQKARNGEIKGLTGIDDPYESPKNPDIKIDTTNKSIDESIKQIKNYLKDNDYI